PGTDPGSAPNSGAVVFHMRTATENTFVTVPAPVSGGRFVAALAVGDVDNDGHDDVAVRAPDAAGGGTVYVPAGGTSSPAVTWTVTGQSGDGFGTAVSFFDGNGDGFADLVVGAPGRGAGGAFIIYEGRANGLQTTPTTTVLAPEPEYDD